MSDDRSRRRLGDDTKGRIADLAAGWSVDAPADAPGPVAAAKSEEVNAGTSRIGAEAVTAAKSGAVATPNVVPGSSKAVARAVEPGAPAATRAKPKTVPPPPPGSAARKAIEEAADLAGAERALEPIARAPEPDTSTPPAATSAQPQRPGVSPAPNVERPAAPKPPPIPPRARRDTQQVAALAAPAPARAANDASAARAASIIPTSAASALSAKATASAALPAIPAPAPAAQPARPNRATGSASAIVERLPLPAETSGPTAAPPLPPPPPVGRAGTESLDDEVDETIAEAGVVAERSAIDNSGRLAVPRGEFDQSPTVMEPDKLRIAHGQATMKRDAVGALLGLAEPALTAVKPVPVGVLLDETAHRLRADPTAADLRGDPSVGSIASTSRFERGDPTLQGRADATAVQPPSGARAKAGRLRTQAALRRKRGLYGDVRYVFTTLFGVRRAKRELATLTGREAQLQQSRQRHLVTLGRAAVTTDAFDHPALGPAREDLAKIEDDRSQHAGQVAAADAELTKLRRDRESAAKQAAAAAAALDAELGKLAKRLEPLERESAAAKRKAADMRESLRRLDAKIAATEQSLVSVKGEKVDRAAVAAELATLRADRTAVQRDEPALAAELDALAPRIAALEAQRAEIAKQRTAATRAEEEDQRRTEELLAAIGAKRKVVDRAAATAEAQRDKVLFELAERLYVDRPDDLAAHLAPVDEIDVELGTADRRAMELREILASVDRWKLARGIAVLALIAAAAAAAAAFLR